MHRLTACLVASDWKFLSEEAARCDCEACCEAGRLRLVSRLTRPLRACGLVCGCTALCWEDCAGLCSWLGLVGVAATLRSHIASAESVSSLGIVGGSKGMSSSLARAACSPSWPPPPPGTGGPLLLPICNQLTIETCTVHKQQQQAPEPHPCNRVSMVLDDHLFLCLQRVNHG